MKQLGRRVASSILLIGVVLWTLFQAPLWVFSVVVSTFILVGLYEFFTMVRNRGMLVHRPLSLVLGLIFTGLVVWRSMIEPGLVPTPILGRGATAISWMWDIFWPATIIIIFVRQLSRENTFEALGGLATTLFGLAYVAALFSYFFYIRTSDPEQGGNLIAFLILVTKMGDAGAYGVGNLFGRSPLMPRISPKKTVEGLIGAVLASGLAAWAGRGLLGAETIFGQPVTPVLSIALGLLLGVCGQLGDLAESLIKRDCQVKDSGMLIPGLGGVLDVIDSLLFTAPIFYAVLIYG